MMSPGDNGQAGAAEANDRRHDYGAVPWCHLVSLRTAFLAVALVLRRMIL